MAAGQIKITTSVVLAVCPCIAFAYIDPGTGSILIQGLIAAIAAIGVTLKLYWHRFVGFFRRGDSSRETKSEPTSNPDQGQESER